MKRAEAKRKKYKMSETETLEQEIETVETNAVEELINQITTGELNKAEGSFKSIIDDKMADALEAQRIAVAGQIFNGDEEVSDEDIVDEYIEDEEDGNTEETEDETLELGGEAILVDPDAALLGVLVGQLAVDPHLDAVVAAQEHLGLARSGAVDVGRRIGDDVLFR